MAVTHALYGPLFENLLKDGFGNLSSAGTEVTVALMSSNHSFDQNDKWWSDVSANQVSTTEDYEPKVLGSKTVTYGTSTRRTDFDGANVSFGSTVSIKAFGAVLYHSGGTSTYRPLISCANF